MRGLRVVLLVLLASCRPAPPVESRALRAHVYVVVVDGLDARFATSASMPRLFALAAREPERTTVLPHATAVMPARTNPNHVSLLTGTYAEAHGITGNSYLPRTAAAQAAKLDAAALIEVETIFTVIESDRPQLVTAGVFGKPKLGRLFRAVPGRQRAPDVFWSSDELPRAARDPATGYSFDADTMGAALGRFAAREPDLAVINLADVDRTAHGYGPDSVERSRAVTGADAQIGRLVDDLVARGRWSRSILFVTADHGFTAIQGVVALGPVLARAGLTQVVPVADGGVEHLYAVGGDAASLLARAAAIAARTPGVAEVLARIPIAGAPLLAERHPGWHLDHERTGDLLLVAAPGRQFVDPDDPVDARLRGNHGGPHDLRVPFVVSGGFPALRTAPPGSAAGRTVDVAPTIAALLGVRAPRRVDGTPVPAASAGQPLRGLFRSDALDAAPSRSSQAAD
jgi:hypothetical protein